MEIWKDIDNSNGYQVSNYGNVRNRDGYILSKVTKMSNPYNNYQKTIVWIRDKKHKKNCLELAPLVYKYFLNPNINTRKNVVKYKDNNYQNCNANNLYTVTRKGYFNEKEILKTRKKNIYSYNGENLDLNELHKKSKIKKNTLISRLKNNWTIEEAIKIPRERSEFRLHVALYKYKDKVLSVKQISKKYNIQPTTFYSRIKSGWTVEEAIEIPVAKYKNRGVKY